MITIVSKKTYAAITPPTEEVEGMADSTLTEVSDLKDMLDEYIDNDIDFSVKFVQLTKDEWDRADFL